MKFIREFFVFCFRQAVLLIHKLSVTFKQKRRQFVPNQQETERLDRLRNPSKYLGK